MLVIFFTILIFLFLIFFLFYKNILILPLQNNKLEIYQPVQLADVIFLEEGTVISEEFTPTSLGEVSVFFQYKNASGQIKKGKTTFSVVDTTPPYVHLGTSYQVAVGKEEFIDEILCADNYDNRPSCVIEGDYDLNKVGNYSLTFVATDSSNNATRKKFTLSVYQPSSSGSNSTTVKEISTSEIVSIASKNHMKFGIDVSKWQGDIDWEQVKNAGVSFVMIRIGSQKGMDGEYIMDPYFEQNYKGATVVGLPVGVYFYSYGKDKEDAKSQATWIIDTLDGRKIDLPIAFDWECFSMFSKFQISLYELNEIATSFFQTIEAAGYDTMLYGSKNYLMNLWIYNRNDVWLAHYTKQTDYEEKYRFWQITNQGKIPGISGFVDINFASF